MVRYNFIMCIESRLYQDISDLEAMIELIIRTRPPRHLIAYPGLIDLQELLSLPEVQVRTRLWFNKQSDLIGYAFVDEMSNFFFEADTGMESAFEECLLDWVVTEARQAAQERQQCDQPGISCRSDDLRKQLLLEQRGFRHFGSTLRMARPLGDPIPVPSLPPGFTIRPSRGAAEAEAWVALHRAAHGTDYMTVERRLSIIEVDEFDPTLDLVVVAPNGRLAAYCIGTISARENSLTGLKVGYTDPVATHPAYQRLGLCRALLCTAMRLLRERGVEIAWLSTSQDNQAMRLAAEAVGYRVESETCWYELALTQD